MRPPYLEARRYMHLALLVVVLLTACSKQRAVTVTPPFVEGQNADQPTATNTSEPTPTSRPTNPPAPADTPVPTSSPTLTSSPTIAPTATEVVPPTETAAPTEAPTETPASQPAQTMPVIRSVARPVELLRVPDTDPAPPFTILVDAIRLHEDGRYKVTGTIRNDGSEIYESIGVRASFLDDEGNSYLPFDVFSPCLYLEPGAECPFSLGIYGRDLVEYRLHPNGRPADEYLQPVSLVLSGLNASSLAIGYVNIVGTVTNASAVTVKSAVLAGELLDANGQIVSVGSTRVVREMKPGSSVPFDLYIEYEPYYRYHLHIQAVQD